MTPDLSFETPEEAGTAVVELKIPSAIISTVASIQRTVLWLRAVRICGSY
jgi:hypothetical protein